MWIQLHIIEPPFMFVTMFPFSKVGYMHLATRFLSKASYCQQCSFRRLDICIFAKMFSREVTYIFQGFFSKVGYVHLWQQCSFRRSIFHPKAIFSIKLLIKKGVHMWSSMSIQAYNMLEVHCNMYIYTSSCQFWGLANSNIFTNLASKEHQQRKKI